MFKKLIIILSIVVFILFVALLMAAWSLGAFAPVSVSLKEQGPYYFLSSKTKTLYQNIPEQLKNIIMLTGEDNLDLSDPGALIYSDPTQVSFKEIVVRAGYIISDSLEVDSPLVVTKIYKRKILEATIEANPSISVFKIYPALNNWLENNSSTYQFNLPALELYKDPHFTMEMPIQIIEN